MDSSQQTVAQNAPPASNASLNFINVLQRMLGVSDRISDLIFSPGRAPQVELMGKLQAAEVPGPEKLTPAHTPAIAKLIIGNHQRDLEQLDRNASSDLY